MQHKCWNFPLLFMFVVSNHAFFCVWVLLLLFSCTNQNHINIFETKHSPHKWSLFQDTFPPGTGQHILPNPGTSWFFFPMTVPGAAQDTAAPEGLLRAWLSTPAAAPAQHGPRAAVREREEQLIFTEKCIFFPWGFREAGTGKARKLSYTGRLTSIYSERRKNEYVVGSVPVGGNLITV